MRASNIGLVIAIAGLTACQLDVVLSLVDKEGNPSPARLYVRVTQDSMTTVADHAMEQAQSAEFSRVLDSQVLDALSDKRSLATSIGAVLKLIKPLAMIGDEIAKVCFLVFWLDDQN